MPLLVEEPGQGQHGGARQGVQRHHPQPLQAAGYKGSAFVLRALNMGTEAAVDLHHRGEEAQIPRLPAGPDAQQEFAGQAGGHHLQEIGQEVRQQIEYRQCEGVACQHGAQRRHAEEQQRNHQHRDHRIDDSHQVEESPAQRNEAQQPAGDGVRDQRHGQPREGVGDEQARPVRRQSVHHPR